MATESQDTCSSAKNSCEDIKLKPPKTSVIASQPTENQSDKKADRSTEDQRLPKTSANETVCERKESEKASQKTKLVQTIESSTTSDCYVTDPKAAASSQGSQLGSFTISLNTKENSVENQMTLDDKNTPENSPIEGDAETVTTESFLMKHIIREDSAIKVTPCAVLVSGVKKCGKTSNITHLFHHVTETSDKKCLADFKKASFKKVNGCMSYCRLVVTGQHSYDSLSWLIPSEQYAVIICLLAYFADLCNKRKYKKLDCLSFKSTESKGNHDDSPVWQKVMDLYIKLQEHWNTFKSNQRQQSEILNGITLINVFDIGPDNAATDFLAILNKYCKRSVHLVCYDNTRDRQALREELVNDSDHHINPNTTGNQFLKSLKGCVNENQIVVETAINHGQESEDEINLTRTIKEKVGTKNVHSMIVSKDKYEHTKTRMENFGKDSNFHKSVHLRELVLLLTIRKASESRFWLTKDEVDSFADYLQFRNGSLDMFLRLFTSFGCIIHIHDIPALASYIITDIMRFIEQLHDLYQINEGLAQYGLYQCTDDQDRKIIFEFLTNLGMAVDIKSTQIEFDSTMLKGSSYCYIPSARSPNTELYTRANKKNDVASVVISFNESVAENLQACLCNEILHVGGKLIPTTNPNATIMRISENDPHVVELKDFSKDAKITMLRDDQLTDEQVEIKTFSYILSRYPCAITKSGQKLRYKVLKKNDLTTALENKEYKLECIREKDIPSAAKELAKKYNNDMASLRSEFGMSMEKSIEHEIIGILSEFAENDGKEELTAKVAKLLRTST